MVLNRKDGSIEHKQFRDILSYFGEGDVMIFNNTRVFSARMYGNKEKTGAKIEVFLLRELNKTMRLWDVLVDPARKIRVGNKLYFGENDALVAEVIDNTTSRGRTIRFLFDGTDEELTAVLESLGETPIPRLLGRDVEDEDKERFQTIYATQTGAVAAPSAGLHFSRELMKRLEINGVNFADVTLHIGLGAFRSVEVEDLTKHKSESENFIVSEAACNTVNAAIDAKKRICSIGTTTMRAIESSVAASGHMKPVEGWTDKFIFPPYDFSIANSMITNFHLPESTLLMMAAAFAGYDNLMKAYEVAQKEKYRFFTYGDAMLII
jgi:S-adenosylmethionine:tRNA ribosyltransferase-isomerase